MYLLDKLNLSFKISNLSYLERHVYSRARSRKISRQPRDDYRRAWARDLPCATSTITREQRKCLYAENPIIYNIIKPPPPPPPPTSRGQTPTNYAPQPYGRKIDSGRPVGPRANTRRWKWICRAFFASVGVSAGNAGLIRKLPLRGEVRTREYFIEESWAKRKRERHVNGWFFFQRGIF